MPIPIHLPFVGGRDANLAGQPKRGCSLRNVHLAVDIVGALGEGDGVSVAAGRRFLSEVAKLNSGLIAGIEEQPSRSEVLGEVEALTHAG
jgi:hypothetical protein